MTKLTNTTPVTSALNTPAYEIFLSNTGKLTSFIDFLARGIPGLTQEVRQKVDKLDVITVQTTEFKQELTISINNSDSLISGLNTGLEWMAVLMVTIVETYIIDVLVYAASSDPAFMSKSEMSASYSQIIGALSLDELILEMRHRWARNFLNDGGPKDWIKKLKKMGARGYDSELEKKMETLWGVRHLIVHTTGVVTSDFVQRHLDFGATVDQKIQVKLNHLRDWGNCMHDFVYTTDCYFINHLKDVANK